MTKKGAWAPQKPSAAQPVFPDEASQAFKHLVSFLLEPRSTYSLGWTWEHSLGQNWHWELLGPPGQQLYLQFINPGIHPGLFFGCWSFEWPIRQYPGYNWFWQSIHLTFGLYYHKGSGGRSQRLWQISSGPSHTRFYHLWVLTTSYSGYPTINRIISVIKESEIVVSFFEWIEDSPGVGMSSSRTFCQKWHFCSFSKWSHQFE